MAHRVGIVGASGYGGAELVRLVAGHPALELATVAAHSQAGEHLEALFPNLAGLGGGRTFDPIDAERLAELDLVFLATPHAPALDLGAVLVDAGTKVVDLSAAFRLPAGAFATWYGQPHPRPDLAERAVYGLTEHTRGAVADATLVANPGCYPTASLLALVPLAEVIDVDRPSVIVDGKSGASGAGRAPKDALHFSHVHGDLAAYGAPAHRHTGEIEHALWQLGAASGSRPEPPVVSFTPHLVPMARGLQTTVYGDVGDDVSTDDAHGLLLDAYRDEPFVQVLAPGTFPHTKAVAGSNGCQLSVVVDERAGRVVATSVIDNLGKGAAGQALQNANRMLGLEETTGLSTIGIYP